MSASYGERVLTCSWVGLTEMEVRLQFQKEEAEAAKRGVPAKHRVSPSEFMAECTAIEEQQ